MCVYIQLNMERASVQLWLKESAVGYIILLFSSTVMGSVPPISSFLPHENLKPPTKKEILPPCKVCQALVDSFKKGMEETARGKFEGGDAHWEESRLGSYSNSEVRLVEIQENLCSDVSSSQNQCHKLAEEHESLLEEWWFKKKKDGISLLQFFCIDELKLCCPKNHYGPRCKQCPGGFEKPCSGHGTCKGEGTRKGSGKCICDSGYKGDVCDECAEGYLLDSNTDGERVCVPCHKSCKGYCRGPGPQGCEVCTAGYHHEPNFGCTDIDECSDTSLCEPDKFCVNTDGSYYCEMCDSACDGCTGKGDDKCIQCAEDYIMEDGKCIDEEDIKEQLKDSGKENSSDSEDHAEEASAPSVKTVADSHTEL